MTDETTQPERKFDSILLSDVAEAQERVHENDTPTNRRDFIRSMFACIEGVYWQLKEDLLTDVMLQLTDKERRKLSDARTVVGPSGETAQRDNHIPVADTMRLLLKILGRHLPDSTLKTDGPGWEAFKKCIVLRNRLVHPKSAADLEVSDDELELAERTYRWALATSLIVSYGQFKNTNRVHKAVVETTTGKPRPKQPWE